MQLKDIRGFQVLFGVKQKENIENIDYPVFNEEDLTLSEDIVSTDDADMVTDSSAQRILEEQSSFVVGVSTSSATPGKQIIDDYAKFILSVVPKGISVFLYIKYNINTNSKYNHCATHCRKGHEVSEFPHNGGCLISRQPDMEP